jgi:hypothetical protein
VREKVKEGKGDQQRKRRSRIRREKVNLGSRGSISESQKLAIRYDTGIALSHRNDSHDTVALRYRGTICTVFPMTRTVSYDTYLVSYDTNLYDY